MCAAYLAEPCAARTNSFATIISSVIRLAAERARIRAFSARRRAGPPIGNRPAQSAFLPLPWLAPGTREFGRCVEPPFHKLPGERNSFRAPNRKHRVFATRPQMQFAETFAPGPRLSG